ncbi:MAG: leucine-rich repeat protein [Clostridia bacterium]|nr:leucine-rich repeat protein [Clostridia bacterium]
MTFKKRFVAFFIALIFVFEFFTIQKTVFIVEAASGSTITWPVPGHNKLSRGYSKDHNGIDIHDSSIKGADIIAAVGGTVVVINKCTQQHYGSYGDCGGRGTGLVIYGDDKRSYTYGHMLANSIPTNIKKGSRIERGQKIGQVGTTGYSSGPHLHFGIAASKTWWADTGTDPMKETYGPAFEFSKGPYNCNEYRMMSKDGVYPYKGPAKKYGRAGETAFTKNKVLLVDQWGINTEKNKDGSVGNKWWHIADNSFNGVFRNTWIYDGHTVAAPTYNITYKKNAKLFGAKDANVSGMPGTGKKTKDVTYKVSSKEPSLAGYIFLGWTTNPKGKTASMAANEKYTDNKALTLYAVWKKQNTTIRLSAKEVNLNLKNNPTQTVTVSYEGGYNPAGGKVTVTVNNDVVQATTDNAFGKTSASYTITAKKPGTAKLTIKVYDKNNVMRRKTTQKVDVSTYYSVKFDANGGKNAPATQTKNYKKNLELSNAIPTRSGYVFMGWAESKTATAATYGPGDPYTNDRDTTFYAVWNKDYNISYTLKDGVLSFTGNGDMANYSSTSVPWKNDKSKIKTVVIGKGITSVGAYAFADCTNLTKVVLDPTVKKINSYAFYNCTSFVMNGLPRNIKYIGNRAFAGCPIRTFAWDSGLVIGQKQAEEKPFIGAFAFEGCTQLMSVELPDDLESIGAGAFSGCSALETVALPDSVAVIEDGAFSDCSALSSVQFSDGLTEIRDGVFNGCSALQTVDLPDTVTEIGAQAFAGCSSVTSLSIPASVEVLGDGAFSNCTALADLALPETMTVIGDSTFSGCSALESVAIPSSVQMIGDGTFMGCSALSSVSIPEGVYDIGNMTFANCTALKNVDITDGVSVIDDFAFYNCRSLESVTIPASVTEIKDFAFAGCSALKSVEIPDTVNALGNGAFMECTSLASVVLSDSIESIGADAFGNCRSLATINMPDSLDTIGDGAFAGCTSLSAIEIPKDAGNVSRNAFTGCSALTVSVYSASEAKDDVIDSGVRYDVIVPVESVSIADTIVPDLHLGDTLQLAAEVLPANATDKKVHWVSEAEEVATVSENGLVTMVGPGCVTISAVTEDGDLTDAIDLFCRVPVESISLEASETETFAGNEVIITASTMPAEPTEIEYTWSSSDESIATVNEAGYVTTLQPGEVTITVSAEDGTVTASQKITVNAYIPVENVTIDAASVTLNVGESKTLHATIEPANATNAFVDWVSMDNNVAVADNGTITGIFPGTTHVLVYNLDSEDTVDIEVTVEGSNSKLSIKNNPGTKTISYGETLKLEAELDPPIDTAALCWYVDGVKQGTGAEFSFKDAKTDAVITVQAETSSGMVLIDSDGNELSVTEKVVVKNGFFQRLISFFKNLFGSNRTVTN